jgi:hypothetical protein
LNSSVLSSPPEPRRNRTKEGAIRMAFDPYEPEQRRMLREALKAADISVGDLWLNYFSIGGEVGEYEVEAYLQGLLSLPPIQRDLLAMAANELIDAIPRTHAPYSEDFPQAEYSKDQPGKDSDSAYTRPDSAQDEAAPEGNPRQQADED